MQECVPSDRPVAVEEGVQGEDMRRIGNRVRVIEPRAGNRWKEREVDVELIGEDVPGGSQRQEEPESDEKEGHRVEGERCDSDALVEDRVSPGVLEALRRLGHFVRIVGPFGIDSGTVIAGFDARHGTAFGAADVRRQRFVEGW